MGRVCVLGSVRRDADDFLVEGDLPEYVGQYWGVVHFISGDCKSSSPQRLLVDPDMDHAPNTVFLTAGFTRVQLAVALNFDPCVVDQ